MSPRAAWRLERFGFASFDYAAGKVDWMAAGLATVRADASERRALNGADTNPPTCAPETIVANLAQSAIVVNEQRVVLGRVRARSHPPTSRAEDVMEPGPATVRAHEPLLPLLERMRTRHVGEVLVTTPEGRLLGLIRHP